MIALDEYELIDNNQSDNLQGEPERSITYWVHIPQAGLDHYGFNDKLDLTDCLLLSYIYYFHLNHQNNERTKYTHRKGEKYVWINYRYLINANPLLPIKSKSAISKRLKKLKNLGLIDTYQAPENSIYIKPSQLLKEIFNYYVEHEKNHSTDDPAHIPNQSKEATTPVSPETTGCFPQSAQPVSPRVHSTISNKISNKINNNNYVESKNDSTVSYRDIQKLLKEKKQSPKPSWESYSEAFYELANKSDKTLEDEKLLRDYLKINSRNKPNCASDVAEMSEKIVNYLS